MRLKVDLGAWYVHLPNKKKEPTSPEEPVNGHSKVSTSKVLASKILTSIKSRGTVEIIAYYDVDEHLIRVDIEEANEPNQAQVYQPQTNDQPLTKVTIQGKVTEDNSKTPIAGARIFIKGSGESTMSDKNGEFSLKAYSNTSQIVALHPKFRSKKVPVNLSCLLYTSPSPRDS